MSVTNRKTQVTMFVMLGLVLLIIFILLIFFMNKLKPKSTNVQTVLDELETGRIKSHVTDCMIEVGGEGLEKLGNNGGVIYDFEGGTIPFGGKVVGGDYLNYTSMNNIYYVAYALKKNVLCPEINYKIPDYPYPDKSFNEINAIYNKDCLYLSFYSAFDGVYGQNAMSKLCYIARESGCEGFAKGVELGLTMQKQLEDYVGKKLPLCVDFDSFAKRMNITITREAQPVVEANIHDANILLVAHYPLKISFENEEPITKIIDYQTTLPVRLDRVYNFIYSLLVADSKNIEFNMDEEFISSTYWKQGLNFKRIKDVMNDSCAPCFRPYWYDDIIEITDRQSSVKGKLFVFRVSIEDRRPALDFIQDVTYDVATDHEINIPINAHDPDDAEITYLFLSLGIGYPECHKGSGASYIPPTTGYTLFNPRDQQTYCSPTPGLGGLNLITGFGVADCPWWNDGPTCEEAGYGWSVSGVGTAGTDYCDEDPVANSERPLQGGPYALVCTGGGTVYLLSSGVGTWGGDNKKEDGCADELLRNNPDKIILSIPYDKTPYEVSENIINSASHIAVIGHNTRIRLCDKSSVPPEILVCGAGWCEQDTRIQGYLPHSLIRAPINKYDSGTHKVGVLAMDDHGMFDYQFFWINIIDTSTSNSPTQACLGNCTEYGHIGDCNKWCTISVNQCHSECGDDFVGPDSACWECVYPIVHSDKMEPFDCNLQKKACIRNMPNCFWIRENISNNFEESCYKDIDLDKVTPPAYILTE